MCVCVCVRVRVRVRACVSFWASREHSKKITVGLRDKGTFTFRKIQDFSYLSDVRKAPGAALAEDSRQKACGAETGSQGLGSPRTWASLLSP